MARTNYDMIRPPPAEPPVRHEPDIMDLTKGIRDDVSPREAPINSTPDMQDLRFEQTAIRKDFGWSQLGIGAEGRILALAEHRYYVSNVEYKRLVRLRRKESGSFALLDIWDGTDWDATADSTTDTTTLPADLEIASMVSTLGYLYIATRDDDILYWVESPSPTARTDDFANGLDLDVAGEYADVALANEPSHNNEYIVSYEVTLSLKWDGVGEFGSVSVVVKIFGSNDGFSSSNVLCDTQTHYLECMDEGTPCTSTWVQADAIRRTLDMAALGLSDVTHFRVECDSVTELNADSTTVRIKPNNKATDSDTYAGVEYGTLTSGGNLVTVEVTGTCPHAGFLFAFADRVVALNNKSLSLGATVQTVTWPISGDATNWSGTGSGSALLEDTQADPVNELVAGVAVNQEIAAIFRQRSIMRCVATGNATAALAFLSWHENVGSESPFSVMPVRGGVMFLGHNLNVYYLTLQSLLPVGFPIHEILINDLEVANIGLVDSMYDHMYDEYWLAIPTDATGYLSTAYIFSLKNFLDTQELVWRKKNFSSPITKLAVVSEVT